MVYGQKTLNCDPLNVIFPQPSATKNVWMEARVWHLIRACVHKSIKEISANKVLLTGG